MVLQTHGGWQPQQATPTQCDDRLIAPSMQMGLFAHQNAAICYVGFFICSSTASFWVWALVKDRRERVAWLETG
ncbi:hypothetical protein M0657_009822 [Pyricularia oryzae]|uniref:Uncharacterized protein n=4 Tax=Pyricularia oryzae TaxID=318829 RepID=Q2KEE8_PYRO7|nr:hypothetical protein MGCH7_ch7g1088 [Pyricularia oryzae 70-15]ELQ42367.1 hypothetical protein OOU_Y34scaffold00213g3 [Pyricularia oryzae Y34]KAI7913363.1 hypothetical protein M9X92_009479 [Pyricularia oryzae]KAI7913841.1 hypothetical protein M0657_009822 [Pyricularia oryzae]QBZ65370.1 hypothetical protein PoMZ_12329 [Pyricularia oryzae]